MKALAKFKCWSLAQRVYALRTDGHINIQSEMIDTGTSKVAEYWMDPDDIELVKAMREDAVLELLQNAPAN